MQRGGIERLLNANVDGAGDVAEFTSEFLREQVVALLVCRGAQDGDVDGRGRAEVQNLGNDVRGLKVELHAGKLLRQLFSQGVDVFGRALRTFALELNQNFRVRRADGSGVAVREIDATVGQTDVVENGDKFVFGDRFTNGLIDLIDQASGFFNAQAGARAHVKADLTGVDAWEEIAAENQSDRARQGAKSQETGGEDARIVEDVLERLAVAVAETFKGALEALLEAAQNALFFSDVVFGVVLVFGA